VDDLVVHAIEMRGEQSAQPLEIDARAHSLDDQLLETLLGLRETRVRHQLDGQERVGAPRVRAIADQPKLHGALAAGKVGVHASGVGRRHGEGGLVQSSHVGLGVVAHGHAARERVDRHGLVVGSQVFG